MLAFWDTYPTETKFTTRIAASGPQERHSVNGLLLGKEKRKGQLVSLTAVPRVGTIIISITTGGTSIFFCCQGHVSWVH